MKFFFFRFPTALFALFALAVPPCGAATPTSPAPKLVLEQPSFDFGQIYSGEKVIHVFKFRNAGEAPLILEKVRQSCGCTAAILSSAALEPGATGEIQSIFNSSGFSGQVVKTLSLYSNDPTYPVAQLYLRGEVQPEVILRPNRINLSQILPEQATATKVSLINQGKNELSLGAVQTTSPEVKAVLSGPHLAPGQSVAISLTVTPQTGKRRLGGFILIPLTGGHTSELRIPFHATIAAPPRPQPVLPPATPSEPEPQLPSEPQPPPEPAPTPPQP
ncbi:MAG: DUF1573 domain-containing protein [Deltaproteobacteria bacterium]|nr:DUF1573 domain-containing protein [Deltaproteobacteria bacterium]